MKNRFKGLDLIDKMLDELWTEVSDIIQKTMIMSKVCQIKNKQRQLEMKVGSII